MDGTPPVPATSVSAFVWMLVGTTALLVVVTLLVVRRRRRPVLSLTMGVATLVVVGAGTLYLIVPPTVSSVELSGPAQPVGSVRCGYDRMVWSNMRSDVDEVWQPCRRAARTQLAMVLLSLAAVTMGVANIGLQLTQTAQAPAAARPTATSRDARTADSG